MIPDAVPGTMPDAPPDPLPAARGADADAARTFPGGSELAALCRTLDWSRTPLGPVERWPQALRMMVRTCLESPFPTNLWCGPELVLVYNDGYRRLLGDKHPAALGRPGNEVWAEIWDGIAPLFDAIRAGGPAVFAEDQPFVVERGSEREDVWFTYSLSPVRDEAGEIVAFLNVVSETTGRVLAQRETNEARAAALRAESRMREVFAQAPVGVCVLRGPRHVYELVNPLYQRFFPGRPLLGLPVEAALPEMRGQGVIELLDRVLATGETYAASEYAVQVHRADDGEAEERVFNFVYQPVRDAAGVVDAIVAIATDVTELVEARRTAEVALRVAEEANDAKGQFLAMMSHELRTPLNAIGGYTQLLQLGVHGPVTDAQGDALSRIQQSQRHLLGLINAVLNYARLEAGSVHYDIDRVALPEALREVEVLTTVQARERGLALHIDACGPGGGALAVRADPDKLRQILLNLLSNAIKFTGPGGRVTVSCAPGDPGEPGEPGAPGTVRIAVADTGRGIPADQLHRIFEPFVQVGRGFTSPDAGTGLGLAISRDLARGMGGDLTVRSVVGEGSEFLLVLPAG